MSGAEVSIELFEQAIAKDPAFAPAYAGVAAMLAARSGFDRFDPSERAEMIAKGWAFARKAMNLDPRLPDIEAGTALVTGIARAWPKLQIILTGWADTEGHGLLEPGRVAYVGKDSSPEEFVAAILDACGCTDPD